jgi:hypothetical protein
VVRACRACGYEHEVLDRCDRARLKREAAARNAAAVSPAPVVANAAKVAKVVANAELVPAVKESRHGKHKDPTARREYMRVLMKGKRAAKKNAKAAVEVAGA